MYTTQLQLVVENHHAWI